MATHDYDIANGTGAAVRADINNVLAAIQSNNSNSSSPSTTVAYQWWADTNTGTLKIRNSSNNGWVELFQLDGTLTLEDGSVSACALGFRDDLNTGVFSSADNHFNIATAGVERIDIGTADIIVNDDGNDIDFRIEGSSEANLFKIDAGNNRIGIGTGSPTTLLTLNHATNPSIQFQDSGTKVGSINIETDTNIASFEGHSIVFAASSSSNFAERMRIDSASGNVLIGTSTVTTNCKLSVKGVSSEYPTTQIGHSGFNTEGEFLRICRTDDNAVRYHSLMAKHSSNSAANYIAFKIHNISTTTSQDEIIKIRGDKTVEINNNLFVGISSAFDTVSNAFVQIDSVASAGLAITGNATTSQSRISFFNPNGRVGVITTDGSATNYGTSSDYRLKENATAISDGITRVKTLKPYKFNFKSDATKTLDGFFAHEVTAVPEAITGTKDEVDSDNNPIYQGIDQSKLVPLLVACCQELITKVEALESA